jgi:hypothetical protein
MGEVHYGRGSLWEGFITEYFQTRMEDRWTDNLFSRVLIASSFPPNIVSQETVGKLGSVEQTCKGVTSVRLALSNLLAITQQC